MKKFFKQIVPYCLVLTSMTVMGTAKPNNYDTPIDIKSFREKFHTSLHSEIEYIVTPQQIVNARTQLLMNTYINNAVSGTKRIIATKRKNGYRKSVQTELPGAPYNQNKGTLHCLYGQSTQLKRAQEQLNDTVTLIPSTNNANQSSNSFKQQMKKLYEGAEYSDAIRSGHLYATDQEYNNALNVYLKSKLRGRTGPVADSLSRQYTHDFEKKNYSATSLNPGTIIIVNSGHAVMYLGQGRVENKEFIPDSNGTAICCAYNSEYPAIPLNTWSTTHAFTADISKIASRKYELEQQKSIAQKNPYLISTFGVQHYPTR